MIEKYFKLNWKKVLIIIAAWFTAVVLHNLVSAIFKFEEAFFFILAIFIIPIYLIISVIYTIYKKMRR